MPDPKFKFRVGETVEVRRAVKSPWDGLQFCVTSMGAVTVTGTVVNSVTGFRRYELGSEITWGEPSSLYKCRVESCLFCDPCPIELERNSDE